MALNTLKGFSDIDGFDVVHLWQNEQRELTDTDFIIVDHANNTISFKVQDGPVNEAGINGCQVDCIIEAAAIIVRGLNELCPCRENSLVITKLEEALLWLIARRRNRLGRGVEGSSKK